MGSEMETEMLNSYVGGAISYYEKPSLSNLQTAQHLFQQVLESRSIVVADANKRWNSLGFSMRKIREGDQEFAVISETANNKGRGNGFYVIKLINKALPSSSVYEQKQSSNVVLQAMHTPSDLHIHQVAFKLLMEGKIYIAAAWNTTHRSKVDLGKEPVSYYNSFTSAVARSFSRPRIVQLHAFDAKSHKINGDMILSSSRSQDESFNKDHYEKVVSRMRTELKDFVILHFPKDVRELGGTLNVNAKVFYENNPRGLFFHVEMSLPLRLDLKERQDVRNSFTRCFL